MLSVIPNPVAARLYPDLKMTASAAALAEHITAFSLLAWRRCARLRASKSRRDRASRTHILCVRLEPASGQRGRGAAANSSPL